MTHPTLLGGDWKKWRTRAIAYTLAYATLALVLVGIRYGTAPLYPNLSQLQTERQNLEDQKKALRQEVETLISPRFLRAFALSHGMVPFSKAPKRTATFASVNRPTPQTSLLPKLEMITQWKSN